MKTMRTRKMQNTLIKTFTLNLFFVMTKLCKGPTDMMKHMKSQQTPELLQGTFLLAT